MQRTHSSWQSVPAGLRLPAAAHRPSPSPPPSLLPITGFSYAITLILPPPNKVCEISGVPKADPLLLPETVTRVPSNVIYRCKSILQLLYGVLQISPLTP
eukprot:359009-Chlamydomonas_euryale.AAC.6